MAQSSDQGEEPFVLKDESQNPAFKQLEDLVRQGALKNEKVIYAKEKYAQLRTAYLSMLATEKTLKAEVDVMEGQLKELSSELEKVLKDSCEDEETLELVREDAEQAESEAQMCKEKEQMILMEVNDLSRLHTLYKEKREEIEKEHATALAPLVSRYKLEIRGAKDTIADSFVKKEQYINETEECKKRLQRAQEDIQRIVHEKKVDHAHLEGLESAPDKCRKQADILSTAVKALQLQDQKWSDKVKEVEAEIASLQGTAKHLTEELANSAVQIGKNHLLTEQKERQATDIAKDLEIATLEVDDYLADQVNVDMQLRSKSADLRMEQDQVATRTKEKDKALRRLKVEEQMVLSIQAGFPMLIVERDKVHYEVTVVENERKKVTALVDDLRKEIDLQMHNFLVVEALGREVAASLRSSHKQVAKMEADVASCADIERLKNHHINNLTMMRERMCRQAAQKNHLWKEALKKLHMMDIMVRNTNKREQDLEQNFAEALLLYNLVRSQRNKFATLVQASGVSLAEMKDKLTAITTEVEALQNDVKYKDNVLMKQRAEYQASVRGRTQLLSELTRNTQILRETQNQANEFELEVAKLEGFATASAREMVKTRKLYGLEVADRNQKGIALIDRNDELCIFYEKANVQEEVLKHSEVELHKRMDEIRHLNIQSKYLQQKIHAARRTAPDFTHLNDTIKDLRVQLSEARSLAAKLSDLVESPDNLSRWKLLPGRDLNELELHLKMTAIDDFLSAKADQALEKDLILEEVTALTDDLQKVAKSNQKVHTQHLQKFNDNQNFDHIVTRRVMATISELALCQATVMSLDEEREKLSADLLNAYSLLAEGQCPTEATTREWLAKERELAFLMKWEEREFREREQVPDRRKNNVALTTSTAERRPNAYIEEELGLPKPFGLYSPFKPTEGGAQMRYLSRSEPKPVEL